MATTEERLSALEEKMGDIPVGYTRIQMSKDTAANWEKYNPALLPGEMIIVATPDGKASVKVNLGTSDTNYEDVPTVWDESTADQLKTNLADTRQAASAAATSATNAANSAKAAATSADNAANSATAAASSASAAASSAAAAMQASDGATAALAATKKQADRADAAGKLVDKIEADVKTVSDQLQQAQSLATASAGIQIYEDTDGDLAYRLVLPTTTEEG